jgi:uncharacterized protein (TIGR03437 family)
MTMNGLGATSNSHLRKLIRQVPALDARTMILSGRLQNHPGSTSLRKVMPWIWLLVLPGIVPQARGNLITNGSFENVAPALPTNGVCTTDPKAYPALDPGDYPACSATGWTGEYQIGKGATIGYAGVSFGIPQPDPDGNNALILQTEQNLAPTAIQSIDIPATGSYTLKFYVANRGAPAGDNGPQTVSVLLDDTVLPGGVFSHLPDAWTLETLNFSASAGAHSLTFEGLKTTSSETSARVSAFIDNVSLAPAIAPAITLGGVVPIYSAATTIQSGSWVSIYGSNLATGVMSWKGDFPTILDGTSVSINGKPAYLNFVSPNQVNVQAPDDTALGTVQVVVTNSIGNATSTVTLGQFGPSFCLAGGKYVAGIILRFDGSGSQGGGTYDFIGPAGSSLGYPTVPVKAGDIVELFAVGLGPTDPPIPSGIVLAPGQYGTVLPTNPVTMLINGVSVNPSFAGITEAGLFQINLTIPQGIGTGDVPVTATVGGVQTQAGVLISAQ